MSALVKDVIEEYFDDNVHVENKSQQTRAKLDETRVRLLLRNLIGNARLHGGDASVEVGIERSGAKTIVHVRDHGVGIAAEDIPKLTEPMYRIDPSRTRSTGGFGMGLYLCKLIAEAHDGTLVIASPPGQGTTVTVSLTDQV